MYGFVGVDKLTRPHVHQQQRALGFPYLSTHMHCLMMQDDVAEVNAAATALDALAGLADQARCVASLLQMLLLILQHRRCAFLVCAFLVSALIVCVLYLQTTHPNPHPPTIAVHCHRHRLVAHHPWQGPPWTTHPHPPSPPPMQRGQWARSWGVLGGIAKQTCHRNGSSALDVNSGDG